MRYALASLAILVSGIAHAENAWTEYGVGVPLRPLQGLTEVACEVDVTLHGAIASVEQRVRISNPSNEALGATTDLELPDGARLVGLEIKHGTSKAEPALAVAGSFSNERVSAPDVLGADPAMVRAIPTLDGKPHFRLIVQPLAVDQEATITLRWTRAADIRGGALRLTLPARGGKPCRGTIHPQLGPGVTVARVRVGGVESSSRTLTLADKDLSIDVDLAFKRTEPIVWTQTEALGDGYTAQAITVLTPPVRAIGAKRVLFVVDGSRSMELVGRHRVVQVVSTLAGMLAKGTEVEAIVYDRTAARVLGAWKPIDAKVLASIETAIKMHTAGNGSDAGAALALARQTITDLRGETQIVLVSDGVMGEQPTNALAQVLGPMQVALHAVVLARGRMQAADADVLYAAINRVGGSYRQLDVDELDAALAFLDDWMRPSWLELSLGTPTDMHRHQLELAIPESLRAGNGVVITAVASRGPRKPTLSAKSDKPIKIAAVSAGSAPIAELALAPLSLPEVPGADHAKLRARHPAVDDDRAFVVLSRLGRIAKSRREVTASGGPYTRMIAIDDPGFPADRQLLQAQTAAKGGSAIDRTALELLFKTQLQPAAFACYQRALAREAKLAGTALFKLEIGRGETTRASVKAFGDSAFEACLVDAAYKVTPSLPNPDYNVDDRTIANYPLTFSVREQKPFVIAGDADSSSPLDIDAIQGGVPVKIKAGDTSTPLGDLRPPPSP